MFTGLIEAIGRIERVDTTADGCRLRIAAPFAAEVSAGESIAVDGVCLTAVEIAGGAFEAVLGPETVRVTTLGAAAAGRRVNLERSLRADARLGGHFVLGHVDGRGIVRDVRPDQDSYWIDIDLPADVAECSVPKGSIAIDGVSLTVAALAGRLLTVQIVPFTWTHTTLAALERGQPVNAEADVLGKYVARLLSGRIDQARELSSAGRNPT
jgi:riboflavin synthase